MKKTIIEQEIKKYEKVREEFYNFLDNNLESSINGFNFEKRPTLPSKEVYEKFYKLDYQARRLRAILIELMDK